MSKLLCTCTWVCYLYMYMYTSKLLCIYIVRTCSNSELQCYHNKSLLINRCGCLPSDAYVCSPDPAKDRALVLHVDSVCRKLDVVSSQLQAWDITLSEADLTSSNMVPLQGIYLYMHTYILYIHVHTYIHTYVQAKVYLKFVCDFYN